ncbi:hypothetical protein ACFSQQ_24080 [Mesorhizobium kowhaii]|uniref:Uncharacterized protein n=1 Tax=Mesorhizobium kowhaii TaxID=1300272 RepID=A0A2W7C7L0_9HYPH|nr:hypothetical protein [Mesorhizobium kowhaii]PZV39152.1 hypothetical protein B5V02_03840 [Mesorhizobium kowhaii]
MISETTSAGAAVTVGPLVKPVMAKPILSPRLTIRSDEAAKRRVADTDGTLRRARQVAETNRLI